MTSKFLRFTLAPAALLAISALAQTGSAATPSGAAPLPTAPSSAANPATTTATPNMGTKVGAINIDGAILGTNEGRRDMEALGKKFEPKQTELKNQNDELEGLKKQLTTQEGKLSEDATADLKRRIEGKQKVFDRSLQDAQEEFGSQQQEIANRILNKMAPMIVKYAQENGFGLIIDTSKPWPQSPVLMAGQGMDITQPVVDIYNAQSGVPAPATPGAGAAAKPGVSKPTGTAPTKPATPAPKPDASKQ